jgi:hypothetical protein
MMIWAVMLNYKTSFVLGIFYNIKLEFYQSRTHKKPPIEILF